MQYFCSTYVYNNILDHLGTFRNFRNFRFFQHLSPPKIRFFDIFHRLTLETPQNRDRALHSKDEKIRICRPKLKINYLDRYRKVFSTIYTPTKIFHRWNKKSAHFFYFFLFFFNFFYFFSIFFGAPMVMRLGLVLEVSNKEPTPGGVNVHIYFINLLINCRTFVLASRKIK